MSGERGEVTALLEALRKGQRDAESRLLTLVYGELRKLAAGHLRRERPDHTLQVNDLVHEAYLRMAGNETPWQNRAHFFGAAAQVMRRILVHHARAHNAQKRGDGQKKVSLDEALYVAAGASQHLIELDEALTKLARFDARQARIVELRVFGGLSVEETAEALGCAARTVNREWRVALAWLRQELATRQQP